MNDKYKIILGIGIAAIAGYYLFEPKEEIKKKTEHVEFSDTGVKKTKTTVTTKPDGSSISVKEEVENKNVSKIEDRKQESRKPVSKDWHMAVEVGVKQLEFHSPIYGLTVDKRILGPFWVGGFVDTSRTWGFRLGVSF